MDLPIKIIVSFFVILAVGTTILTISNNLLSDTEDKIKDIGSDDLKSKIIEKDNFDESEIEYIIDNCYKRNIGVKKSEMCYVLKSSSEINLDSMSDFPSYVVNNGGNSKTIYVEFDDPNVMVSD
jgi:hypothetical protein